ncbi:MAG TPA: hypothetical protein VNA25_27860 [Phycisphaerae bacterium]|nr:hypothetical protein [Phycisphaerae bacterium]
MAICSFVTTRANAARADAPLDDAPRVRWGKVCAAAVVVAVAAAVAGMLWRMAASAGAARSRPAGAPASRPARPPEYPPPALVKACNREADKLRARLDDTFAVTVSAPFIIAGNMAKPQLGRYAEGSVVRPAKAMWASYFDAKPTRPITILLFADANSYALWARKLFNDTPVPHFGYYKPGVRTMVMNISTGTGTLVHELTHSLIVYDFPKVPDWFNEGLASLHEQCSVRPDRIIGLTNWRLPGLQAAIRADKLRPLEDLITADDFYGRQQGINYAQARYFCMYMQTRGVLVEFYKHFRRNHAGRRDAVLAVEKVFGKKIADVEKDFLAWVQTLRFPPR